MLVLFESEAGGEASEFREQAFDTERIGMFSDKGLAEEIHAEPEQRAAAGVFATLGECAGAVGDALLPVRAEFDVEEAQAARGDFVLVGNTRGTKHQGHRRELFVFAAVAFAVVAAEEQAEERQFVAMHGKFARNGMTKIAEDGPGIFDPIADGTEELASAEGLLAGGWLRFSHEISPREGPRGMLLLF